MGQSLSWEANRFSASQEISRILWKLKVHYRIHKCPPSVLTLSHIEAVNVFTSHFLKIRLNIILSYSPSCFNWSLSLRFHHQNPVYTYPFPTRATCPAHLILLDFITRTILGEQDRSLSSWLRSFLHSSVTSFPLGTNILLLHRKTTNIAWLQSALNFFLNRILASSSWLI
jgi:hypothetical protein